MSPAYEVPEGFVVPVYMVEYCADGRWWPWYTAAGMSGATDLAKRVQQIVGATTRLSVYRGDRPERRDPAQPWVRICQRVNLAAESLRASFRYTDPDRTAPAMTRFVARCTALIAKAQELGVHDAAEYIQRMLEDVETLRT